MRYECDWLEEVLGSKKFRGKRALEVGRGVGYE